MKTDGTYKNVVFFNKLGNVGTGITQMLEDGLSRESTFYCRDNHEQPLSQ
jgi:hypothetical protein